MSETKFKVGDWVLVSKPGSYLFQDVCVVDEIVRTSKKISVFVKAKDDQRRGWFSEHELEPAPAVKECVTVDNAQTTGKQAFIQSRYDCIDPIALRLVAECVGFGARKYGEENHKKISVRDHLNHAMNHINEHRIGDQGEMHLVHAIARLFFAVELIVQSGAMEDRYFHPDMVEGVSEEVTSE